MPEHAEIRESVTLINELTKDQNKFVAVSMQENMKCPIPVLPKEATLFAVQKGKQMKLCIISADIKIREYTFGFGMSGGFRWIHRDTPVAKSERLYFLNVEGHRLSYYDPRKFGKWKEGDFDPNRGPDPLFDKVEFQQNIWKALQNNEKSFNRPTYEMLMDQKWFNGIGNYLRAEILGRIDVDPRLPLNEYLRVAGGSLLLLCSMFPDECYHAKRKLGLRYDGKEPLMEYYRKDNTIPIKDRNGRTFWMDKKWLSDGEAG